MKLVWFHGLRLPGSLSTGVVPPSGDAWGRCGSISRTKVLMPLRGSGSTSAPIRCTPDTCQDSSRSSYNHFTLTLFFASSCLRFWFLFLFFPCNFWKLESALYLLLRHFWVNTFISTDLKVKSFLHFHSHTHTLTITTTTRGTAHPYLDRHLWCEVW